MPNTNTMFGVSKMCLTRSSSSIAKRRSAPVELVDDEHEGLAGVVPDAVTQLRQLLLHGPLRLLLALIVIEQALGRELVDLQTSEAPNDDVEGGVGDGSRDLVGHSLVEVLRELPGRSPAAGRR